MKKLISALLCLLPFISIGQGSNIKLVVLGTIQDAGSPHIGCERECCTRLFAHPDPDRMVVSLGVVDISRGKTYLFEATPDIVRQLALLQATIPDNDVTPDGIFLTHAHIGHYTGLMYFGKEGLDASEVPVYAMPKMYNYLESNGPWSQLVNNRNIELKELENDIPVSLAKHLKVTPILVVHRDEYSETVGYKIEGPRKSALFIPDIDKWSKWDKSIIDEVAGVDFAFVDGTFFSSEELGYRDMSLIPHPSIRESMDEFHQLSREERSKVYFIHFNHTNPLLNRESGAYRELTSEGFNVAQYKAVFDL